MCNVRLMDPSTLEDQHLQEGVEVLMFGDPCWLPNPDCVGDIMRIHRLTVHALLPCQTFAVRIIDRNRGICIEERPGDIALICLCACRCRNLIKGHSLLPQSAPEERRKSVFSKAELLRWSQATLRVFSLHSRQSFTIKSITH